jgi:hypothetical protein
MKTARSSIMTKRNLKWRYFAISFSVLTLGLSAPAIADTVAYSYQELINFTVSNNATGIQLDASDFIDLDIGNSSSASAVTTFGAPGVTASPSSLETILACSGEAASCAAISENDSTQQAVSNYARGDTFGNGGTIISGLPGPDSVNVWTVAEGRQNTEGSTTGQSGTRNSTEFVFALAADTEVRIDFDVLAELYVQLDQDLVQAQASYNWNASIVEVDTGAVVFSWVPNGVVGGIAGGTELADPFTMNDSRGLVSTGADGTGPQNGAFAAVVTLAGQTNYRLSIGHGSQINTEVEPIVLTGGCRLTGGNATVAPIIGSDGEKTWTYEFENLSDEGLVTTGGQINAPSDNTPVSGHWVHALHGRCAPFKQLFWTGIGNFANQHFDATFPGNCMVIPTKRNQGTQHFVKVMIGDFGENDRPTREASLTDDNPDSCDWQARLQAAGYPGFPGPFDAADAVPLGSILDGKFGDKYGQVCDKCPDYYQIEIHWSPDPASDVIYSFQGHLESGNYQIHPATGEQCPVTKELVPELVESTTTPGKGNKGKKK